MTMKLNQLLSKTVWTKTEHYGLLGCFIGLLSFYLGESNKLTTECTSITYWLWPSPSSASCYCEYICLYIVTCSWNTTHAYHKTVYTTVYQYQYLCIYSQCGSILPPACSACQVWGAPGRWLPWHPPSAPSGRSLRIPHLSTQIALSSWEKLTQHNRAYWLCFVT